jgi:hypothetical protein
MKTKWSGTVEATGFILYALVFGFLGFTLMFMGLPIDNSFLRLFLLIVFYFLIALPIGYFDHRWWPISGLLAWNPLLVGLLGLLFGFEKRPLGEYFMIFLVFALPLGISLGGGWFGAKLWRKRHPHELDIVEEKDERGLHDHFPGILR